MSVVQHRIQKVFAINGVSSYLLDHGPFSFCENHSIKKLIALLNADIFSNNVIDIVVGIQDFNLNVKQTRFAFNPHEISRFFIKELAVDVHLHV